MSDCAANARNGETKGLDQADQAIRPPFAKE
jgi:hypothetical protein